MTAGGAQHWRDPKRWGWVAGLTGPLFPVAGWALATLLGWRWGWWLGPMWAFAVIPALDWWVGADNDNPPPEAEAALDADPELAWMVGDDIEARLQAAGFEAVNAESHFMTRVWSARKPL